jgi:tetratricopeptide (TPR) repeat protein
MTPEIESSRAEIKRYEDILGADPASYCFAPLAELYRKAGLLDEAIGAARKGIGIHPDYVGGYLALGRACFDKGEQAESRVALERVVRVTPDNLIAQKLLSRIYIDIGENGLARKALETILALNPGDQESKVALDELALRERSFETDADLFSGGGEMPEDATSGFDVDDEFLLEEAEIIEELDDEVLDEEGGAEGLAEEFAGEVNFDGDGPLIVDESWATDESGSDPLSTATIAELYIEQGFLKKALKIYRDLLDANPGNGELRQRIVDLKHRIDEDEAQARENAFTADMPFGEEFAEAVTDKTDAGADVQAGSGGRGDAVAVLEGWLDTIGRMKQCRSVRR